MQIFFINKKKEKKMLEEHTCPHPISSPDTSTEEHSLPFHIRVTWFLDRPISYKGNIVQWILWLKKVRKPRALVGHQINQEHQVQTKCKGDMWYHSKLIFDMTTIIVTNKIWNHDFPQVLVNGQFNKDEDPTSQLGYLRNSILH